MTVSSGVDFATVAAACGYRFAGRADTLEASQPLLAQAFAQAGPRFLHLKVRPSQIEDLPRPKVKPDFVARRFKDYLSD